MEGDGDVPGPSRSGSDSDGEESFGHGKQDQNISGLEFDDQDLEPSGRSVAIIDALSAKVKTLKIRGIVEPTTLPGTANKSGTKKSNAVKLSNPAPAQKCEVSSINPFYLPEVISHLFQFIRVQELLKLRLVCKEWDKIACTKFLERGYVQFDGVQQGQMYMATSILHQNSNKRFQHYRIMNVDIPLPKFTKLARSHLKILKLGSPLFRVLSLRVILLTFPNLEELSAYYPADDFMSETASLRLPSTFKTKVRKLVIASPGRGIHLAILAELFIVCPNLKNFHTAFGDLNHEIAELYETDKNRFLINLMIAASLDTNSITLSNLEVLDVGAIGTTIMTTYAILCLGLGSHPLNLTCLEIAVTNVMDGLVFSKLLEALSKTLKIFICLMDPFTVGFRFLVPPTMTKLMKLQVLTGNNAMLLGPLVSASYLPNLQQLNLLREPYNHELEDIIFRLNSNSITANANRVGVQFDFNQCWSELTELGLQAMFDNPNENLRTLHLPWGVQKREMFSYLAKIFPNLRDLRLQNPSCEVIKEVFAVCAERLERLSLRMLAFPENMDSILTGLKRKWCQEMIKSQKFKFANPDVVKFHRFGLKDMSNLKYLELRQFVTPHFIVSRSLTDATLYHGLMYLTKAIQIDLQGCERFSQVGLRELRSELGDSCFVNIITATPSGQSNFWNSYYGEEKFKVY